MPHVQTNDIETYYQRRGEGPPVVFVHGAIMDHAMWEPQVDALSDDYTTVTYDVRGHGRTGGSARERYTVDLYAEDLDALLSALDLDRPVLVGLSLGGLIVQTYATRYPEKVRGVVLADAFTPTRLSWADRLTYASLRGSVLPVRLFGFERVQRAMVWANERFARGAGGDYATIERLQAEMPPIPADEFAKIIGSLTAFPRTDLDLSAITVPTLVLYGEHTTGFVRRHVAKLAAEIPDVEVLEVPGGGHACNLDDPAFVSSAVRDLLGRAVQSQEGV